METFSLGRLGRVIIYAIAVGLTIRVLSYVWRHYLNIEMSVYEGGALAGAVVGFILILGIQRGPYLILGSIAAIIATYFGGKLIVKKLFGG